MDKVITVTMKLSTKEWKALKLHYERTHNRIGPTKKELRHWAEVLLNQTVRVENFEDSEKRKEEWPV